MMKKKRLILPAFFLSIFTPPAMIQAGGIPPVPAAEQAPLLIARQGSFAVDGNILQRPGTYDNSRFPGWGQAVEAGQSYHADHAAVDFQIPADARMLPLIFIHGQDGDGRAERRRKPPSGHLPTSSSGSTSSGSANGPHSTREYSSLRTRIPWTSFSDK